MHVIPAYIKHYISTVPAAEFLVKAGYSHLQPMHLNLQRQGDLSKVLLEEILREQLKAKNRIHRLGQYHELSEENVKKAMAALQSIPWELGFEGACRHMHLLLLNGIELEQDINGRMVKFRLRYIDFQEEEENVYHVGELFEVKRQGAEGSYTMDIVLFVNGIPLALLIGRRADVPGGATADGIREHLRNQSSDGIPSLYVYSRLLLSLGVTSARYGTPGLPAYRWEEWEEKYLGTTHHHKLKYRERDERKRYRLKQTEMGRRERWRFLHWRASYIERFFTFGASSFEDHPQQWALYWLCRKERLLELTRQFMYWQGNTPDIAGARHYFATERIIAATITPQKSEVRMGGLVWHIKGADVYKAILSVPDVLNHSNKAQIIIVSDNVELWKGFESMKEMFPNLNCHSIRFESYLTDLLTHEPHFVALIPPRIFNEELDAIERTFPHKEVYVIGEDQMPLFFDHSYERLREVFPYASLLMLQNIPPSKAEAKAITERDPILDVYTASDAQKEGVICPVLYEGRKLSEHPPKEYIADDIRLHFERHWLASGFEGLVIVEDEAEKAAYTTLLEVSPAYQKGRLKVVAGLPAQQASDCTQVVVYLAKAVSGRPMLYLLGSVNRAYPDKPYGFIIDYHNRLGSMEGALSKLPLFTPYIESDLAGSIQHIRMGILALPELHRQLWDTFKAVQHRKGTKAHIALMRKTVSRNRFFQRLTSFVYHLKMTLSSALHTSYIDNVELRAYIKDANWFMDLRRQVLDTYSEVRDISGFIRYEQLFGDWKILTEAYMD